ncbi:hypothetical protein BDW74DRAFT_152871 [Aspergillus multicolor]|uniref:uncharacterized protein n=1 Tax=Aspergillus multicolor TaxID=41759 RepID=UPI003CCD56A4
MPTANGSFQWVAPNQINARFEVDGSDYNSALTVHAPLPNFGYANATLDYETTDLLAGSRSFDGHVGNRDFSIDFDNGPTLKGNLDIDHSIGTSGRGIWTVSL